MTRGKKNNAKDPQPPKKDEKIVEDLTKKMEHVHISETSKKVENGASTEEMSREDVAAARKAKKAEAKLKKEAATAAKKDAQKQKAGGKVGEGIPKQQNNVKQQQNNAPKQEKQQKPQQQSALKKEEPSSGPKQVRFDLTMSDSEDGPAPSTAKMSPSFEASTANVHTAFLKLAASCESKQIVGVDAICVQFMQACEEFITSYEHNQERKVSDDLNQAFKPQLSYLSENGSHPFPLAIGNLIRQLKKEINSLPDNFTETEAKTKVLDWLHTFYIENFEAADNAISEFTMEKLQSRRRVLTYSWCPLVERVLIDAAEKFDDLEVMIIDSPADRTAKQMLKNLSEHNITIKYGLLDAIGYVIRDVDVVLLGCTAILSNGHAVSDRGSSLVALTAQAFNIPVLIAAKTYKFVDKVQTIDKSAREKTALMGEKYETIPDDLITALVTDLRILPASSAPAVLRAKQLAIV